MAEFRGANLLFEWIGTWGTVDCSQQYQKLSLNHEADMLDASAGSVAYREFIAGLSQWDFSFDFLHNGATTPIGGTQFIGVFLPGVSGTARISPFGTATGAIKYTGAALVKTVPLDEPYDDLVKTSIAWQGSGTLTISNY